MAQKIEKRRARRRRLTFTVALRRRDHHLSVVHGGAENVDCTCELANTYFAKRRALACDCRKRRKGRPRADVGMCDVGSRDRIYEWRQEVRELRDAIRAGREFEDPDRTWPRGKTGSKEFVIEKRDLRRHEPGPWYEFRRYRTRAGRDSAMARLRRNTPRAEFRGKDPDVGEGLTF